MITRREAMAVIVGGAFAFESKDGWVRVADSLPTKNGGRVYQPHVLAEMAAIVNRSERVILRDSCCDDAAFVGIVYAARICDGCLEVKALAGDRANGKMIVTCCMARITIGGFVRLARTHELYFALSNESNFASAEPIA